MENNEVFIIDNDQKADWAIRKIKEAQEERDRLLKIAEERLAELNEQIEGINLAYENSANYFKGALRAYFETEYVKKKETKTQQSYQLLSGKLVFKKPAVKIVKPKDETALMSYLEANEFNEFIETKKTTKWAEFKKTITIDESSGKVVSTDTGELLQFIETEQTEGQFDVK